MSTPAPGESSEVGNPYARLHNAATASLAVSFLISLPLFIDAAQLIGTSVSNDNGQANGFPVTLLYISVMTGIGIITVGFAASALLRGVATIGEQIAPYTPPGHPDATENTEPTERHRGPRPIDRSTSIPEE